MKKQLSVEVVKGVLFDDQTDVDLHTRSQQIEFWWVSDLGAKQLKQH